MIWGKTRIARAAHFGFVFAWRPVTFEDGRRAWLEIVYREWYEDEGANWAGDNSRWKYFPAPWRLFL